MSPGAAVPAKRLRLAIRGAVQGVGFRPHVFRLARDLGLGGWVRNTPGGVLIEVEGPWPTLSTFAHRVRSEPPRNAVIQAVETTVLDPVDRRASGFLGHFEILHSEVTDDSERGPRSSGSSSAAALVTPDIATCSACLAELADPGDRRYRYPFINCTQCGPRASLVLGLPYDRPNTTMAGFAMCEQCRFEYDDPDNRRFHAQPNACPACGPRIAFWDRAGRHLASGHDALAGVLFALRRGEIVAVKGLGGFHLMADAGDRAAIARLRAGKHRPDKPFAVLFPSLDAARAQCRVSDRQAELLAGARAPIVLCERRADLPHWLSGSPAAGRGGRLAMACNVAPNTPYLGIMLPYTPLHHLIAGDFGRPLVATSGNRSGQPICTDEREAVDRLGGLADAFLVHDRPIARPIDDSVVHVVEKKPQVLRCARGYAPLAIEVPAAWQGGRKGVAVGGHLKTAIAARVGQNLVLGQHIGDLDTAEVTAAYRDAIADLCAVHGLTPEVIACDAHPEYRTTQIAGFLAEELNCSAVAVQHHHAHVLACMADNRIAGEVLGVAWDGTGYGADGTIWGGEFLRVDGADAVRVAHLRQFRLPGGDRAARQPWRSALGVLGEAFGAEAVSTTARLGDLAPLAEFDNNQLAVLATAMTRGTNAPLTSSAGRLFDAVAAIVGLHQRVSFEGQAAMALEHAIGRTSRQAMRSEAVTEQRGRATDPAMRSHYDHAIAPAENGVLEVDWTPAVRAIVDDVRAGRSVRLIAARFHNMLVDMIAAVAERAGIERVVLTGGCFHNRYLAENAIRRLRENRFEPYWHGSVPPGDGGIACGQLAFALLARG